MVRHGSVVYGQRKVTDTPTRQERFPHSLDLLIVLISGSLSLL